MLGKVSPIINAGNPINTVQTLNPCPVIAGNNQPINNGNPNPIRIPNSRSCFFEIFSPMINLVQTLSSIFDLCQPLVAQSSRGFDFEEQAHPSQFS